MTIKNNNEIKLNFKKLTSEKYGNKFRIKSL